MRKIRFIPLTPIDILTAVRSPLDMILNSLRRYSHPTQTIIACSRNLPAISESDEDDNEGFRRTMEMLDQIADFKRDNPGFDF